MILILDNIRSAHNVGSILRTAEFFGVKNVFLCGITPGIEHKEVKKTALGAEKSLIIHKYSSTLRLLKKLTAEKPKNKFSASSFLISENYTILALEQHPKSISLNQKIPERRSGKKWLSKVVLVVGNEITGVNKKILELADCILEIPRIGEKESLNVSVATGIAIYSLTLKLTK